MFKPRCPRCGSDRVDGWSKEPEWDEVTEEKDIAGENSKNPLSRVKIAVIGLYARWFKLNKNLISSSKAILSFSDIQVLMIS